MDRRNRRRRAAAAFTLLEVLLVLVILVVLGSMATVAITGQRDNADRKAARSQVQIISQAIKYYQFDMKKYPQSLEDLREKPSDSKMAERWGGPYLDKKLPLDPWDEDYRYESKDNSYRVWSVGPDGSDGTDDDIASDDE
ncbi:Type II secretion system protein G precursor [Planctomycetes bacterium MalM25]|nr:Type II secretion system protein G precursor [Planctomycetes bacterium MalM25]